MGRMVRKQLYLQPEQDRRLKARARALGVTESDIIRQSLDEMARTPPPLPHDPDAWKAEVTFIMKRARLKARGQPRRWTRDDLYDR